MKFKSQICTTIEQSNRLLKLGLKKETADMCYTEGSEDAAGNIEYFQNIIKEWRPLYKEDVPAWSLHRLMEIGNFINVGFLDIEKMYECCIQMLEGQIRGGIINKEYVNK